MIRSDESTVRMPAVGRSQIPADIPDYSVHSYCLGVAEARIEKLRAALELIESGKVAGNFMATARTALHLDDVAAPLMDRAARRKGY